LKTRIITLIIFYLICSNFITAQTDDLRICGTVLNSQTNQPLPFANILLNNSNNGTTTDKNGNFVLMISSKESKIIISYLGFKTKILDAKEFAPSKKKKIYLNSKAIMMQTLTVFSKKSDNSDELNISTMSLEKNQIEKVSNVLPDVLRSFQALPRISTNNEFSAEYNVRGGNKDENLILVNGAQVYEPYHMKEAQNASIGIFNINLIDKVNLITGGFSARYGDRLSSVANIIYREGISDSYKGSGTLSLAFVEGYVEGPFLKNGSFIFAGRKTFMEYLIHLTNFGHDEIKTAEPSFYDIQGLLSYNLSKKSKLKLLFLHSTDNFSYNPEFDNGESKFNGVYYNKPAIFQTKSNASDHQNGNYYSSLLDLQNTSILSNNAILRTKISYYDQDDNELYIRKNWSKKNIFSDNNYFEEYNRKNTYNFSLLIRTLEAGIGLGYQITPFYETKSGINFKTIKYGELSHLERKIDNIFFTKEYPDTAKFSFIDNSLNHDIDTLNTTSYKIGGYLENIFQIGKKILFNVSGRVDYFDLNKELLFSPRLNISYSTNFGATLRAAWGHYYEFPIYTQLLYPEPRKDNTKAQMAIHYILGLEQNLSLSSTNFSMLKFKIEVFYKDYKKLISSFYSHFAKLDYTRKNDASGYAKGFELYFYLNIPNFYTWVSYSFLIAREKNHARSTNEYPRLTGQTHTLSWITNFNLGKRWSINTKFYYGSGYPYAPKYLSYEEKSNQYIWETEPVNSKFLPSYQRVDLKISKEFKLNSHRLKTFIEISNLFNKENIRGYEYGFDSKGNPKVTKIVLWPLLPSFGIKYEF